MSKITIGYRARFPEVFSKYLEKSLNNLKGNFEVIKVDAPPITNCADFSSDKYPAENYNEMIDLCQTEYLLLVHEDVIFTDDLIERLEETINLFPDFGAIGLVGPDSAGVTRWSSSRGIFEVDTLDSCFIMIRKDLGIRFNSEVFNELHLYVEDYCGQLNKIGRKIYTVKQNPDSKIEHCSATWNTLGFAWGNYNHYKQIFLRLYPNLKTT